jgi:hypothetical protein
MNVLGYRVSDENGFSVQLTIDGAPLAGLVGARDSWIPYWLFEGDLPRYGDRADDRRIVAVCSCGEYGCGCTVCQVRAAEDGSLTFCEFELDVTADGASKSFLVARDNYRAVLSAMLEEVQAFKDSRDR